MSTASKTRVSKHRVDWKLVGHTIVLAPGIDWGDLIVRAELRSDARLLSRRLGHTIPIKDQTGALLDTIPFVG